MSKFLILIDTSVESERSNNIAVYQTFVKDAVRAFVLNHNDLCKCNSWKEDETIDNLTVSLENIFNGEKIDFLIHNTRYIELDDENMAVPVTSPFFLFEFVSNNSVEYRAVQDNIAGYSIKLMVQDFNPTKVIWNKCTLDSDDIGYNLTEASDKRNETCVLVLNDKSKVNLTCYCVKQI